MPKSAVNGPLITVLVPCFNVEKYVEACINSILAQTYSNLEVICINDGSTDSTPQILERYAKSDKRIRVISKVNSGYGHSMNIGLDAAKGDYIGIVESDDFIEPDMFEKLLKNALKYNLDISRAGYFEYESKTGINTKADDSYVPKNTVLKPIDHQEPFWQPPSIWAAIYSSRMIKENEIRFLETPGASFQDTSFAFKAYCCCDRFLMSDQTYLHYRIDNSSSSVNNPKKVFCVCDEYDEMWKFASSDPVRYEKTKRLIPFLQLATYKWNFNRLSPKLRKEFLKNWSPILREYIKNKLIDWKSYRRADRRKMVRIAYLPFTINCGNII